jgi:hypothetical protein
VDETHNAHAASRAAGEGRGACMSKWHFPGIFHDEKRAARKHKNHTKDSDDAAHVEPPSDGEFSREDLSSEGHLAFGAKSGSGGVVGDVLSVRPCSGMIML